MKRPADLRGRCTRCYHPLSTIYTVPLDAPGQLGCARCTRHDAGLCSDCGQGTIIGKHRRCANCKRLRRKEQNEARVRTPEQRARANRRLREDGDARERKYAQRRVWNRLNRERVAQQKAREYRRHQAKYDRYQAQYRAENREARAFTTRRSYRKQHPFRVPSCQHCGRTLLVPRRSEREPALGRLPSICDGCCNAAERSRRKRLGRSYPALPHPLPAAQQACLNWRFAATF